MSDDSDNHDENQIIQSAIGELLSLAASVAELQITDEGADEIYALCDLVAEYFQIERVKAITTEHADGSFTTHFETFTGEGELHSAPRSDTRTPIPGSIRTKGKPKLRLIDCSTPLDLGEADPRDDDDEL